MEYLLKYSETFTIRAITRNPESTSAKNLTAKGVEVVKADLLNLDEVISAFAGAWGVFAVTQFYEHGYDLEQLHGKNMVEAAKINDVKHFVWSTVEGGCGPNLYDWTQTGETESHRNGTSRTGCYSVPLALLLPFLSLNPTLLLLGHKFRL